MPSLTPPESNRKNLYLLSGGNISNHEDTFDYIRYAGLGYLIGSTPTGGCCGMVNRIPLPSGGEVSFTGTKWLSNMGPDHYYYRKGIVPDLLVPETAEDIKAGRDVVFEAALKVEQNN